MACTPEAKTIKIEKEMRKEKEEKEEEEDEDEAEDDPNRLATNAQEGFHVENIEDTDSEDEIMGGIWPCPIDEYNEELLIELSNLALQTYNDQNGASFKFDNLIEAKQQVDAGYIYCITFAAHSGETSGTFRGGVWLKINDEKEVEFCKMI